MVRIRVVGTLLVLWSIFGLMSWSGMVFLGLKEPMPVSWKIFIYAFFALYFGSLITGIGILRLIPKARVAIIWLTVAGMIHNLSLLILPTSSEWMRVWQGSSVMWWLFSWVWNISLLIFFIQRYVRQVFESAHSQVRDVNG